MTLPLVLIVLGIIFLYGGIKGYSITHLLQGKIEPRTPPNPPGTNSPVPGGGIIGDTSGYSSPITKSAQFERVDQGVDYSQTTPYKSIGSGIVRQIDTGWAGGTGKAVYIDLDNPVQIGNRKYTGFYTAETNPLVSVGQRVEAGQPIASGGAAEIGFLINGRPTPLQGGLGASTRPTQAGTDFLNFVRQLLGI